MEPSSSTSTGKKRRVFPRETREVVWNVYSYFKKHNTGNLLDTVVEATGVPKSTVVRIIKEGKLIKIGVRETFMSPSKHVTKPSPKSTVDDFAEQAIRRLIYNFHVTEKRTATVRSIYNQITVDKDIFNFTGKETSFRRLLLKMGFRWRKAIDNRKVLMERNEIRQLRCSYIRSITKYRSEGRPIIYTDETYIHSSHTTTYKWFDKSNEGLKHPISKGKRLIIVHAGGNAGFVSNALLIFQSGLKSGDYHDDMNFTNYNKWIEDQLIPNLPPCSVIVMDNASYHNVLLVKHPNLNTKKEDMQKWLSERGITYQLTFTKPELYRLIQLYKPSQQQYTVDSIFARHGHTVCRLPPYHPELNPIEKIWGIVKNWVATRNVTFKMPDVERLTREKFASVGSQEWSSTCEHVIKIENEYIEKENILDNYCDELIINLGNESSEDEDMFLFSGEE